MSRPEVFVIRHASLLTDGGKILFGAIIGALINRRFEGDAELLSHWGHVSAFKGNNQGTPFIVHAHEVVLRNDGRRAAHNVRITHAELPQFNITPSVPFTVEALPDGRQDIVIPILVSKQQITISYLYFPPLTVAGVNAGIRCDEGFPKVVEMELTQKTNKWTLGLVWVLLLIGCGTVLFWGCQGLVRLGL